MSFSQPTWYISLLGLAEYFRCSNPPDILKCLQCLQAVFTFDPPEEIRVRTHLQIANVLSACTKNIDLAKENLQKAWDISQNKNYLDNLRLEVGSKLAKLHISDKNSNLAKSVLKNALCFSSTYCYWHCRLLFQLAEIYLSEKQHDVAAGLMMVGFDYTNRNCSHYHKVLFLLSRCFILLTNKKLLEFIPLSNSCAGLINNWQGGFYKKDYLHICLLMLQCHGYLISGQLKTVKPILKDLKERYINIQSIGDKIDMHDELMWLSNDVLNVLIRSLGIIYNSLVGNKKAVQKHGEKVLICIDKLRISTENKILTPLQLTVLEHMASCNLVAQQKVLAIKQIAKYHNIVSTNKPDLLTTYKPHLHVLLALYAMSMGCDGIAEQQFKLSMEGDKDGYLRNFAVLNISVILSKYRRIAEFDSLSDHIKSLIVSDTFHNLKTTAFYVLGLKEFLCGQHDESYSYLIECLNLANKENCRRLASFSYSVLSNIAFSVGDSGGCLKAINNALIVGRSMSDITIERWGLAFLQQLYKISGNVEDENKVLEALCKLSSTLLRDQLSSYNLPEHKVIFSFN